MALIQDSTGSRLQCDMYSTCTQPVTHIGEKGWVYCTEHARNRQKYERCRKMRKWEINLLKQGKPLPSYKPIRMPESLRSA